MTRTPAVDHRARVTDGVASGGCQVVVGMGENGQIFHRGQVFPGMGGGFCLRFGDGDGIFRYQEEAVRYQRKDIRIQGGVS